MWHIRFLGTVALIGLALGACPARASLQGATYDFSITGSSVLSSTGSGAYTDPANAVFCIGPASGCAVNSGMAGYISFVDISPTLALITLEFSGSTYGGAAPFTVDLGNFVGPTITGVTYASGGLADGSLSGVTWNGTDALFTFSPGGNTAYSALGGANVVFDAAMTPTAAPEPASMILLGSGLIGLIGTVRRRKRTV